MKLKKGRPAKFTQDLADEICNRLAGGESLREICEGAGMPSRETVRRWLADGSNREFLGQYARAREAQADVLFEECLNIADTPLEGIVEKLTKDGAEVTKADMLGHRRLQVDTRKWMASKLAPKKYGDKLEVDATHGVADPVLALIYDIRNRQNSRPEDSNPSKKQP